MRIRASKSRSYPLLNKNKHILLCLCLLPGTLPLGVSLAGSALQPFLPRAADRFLQVSSVSYHLWELLISSLHFQVPFLPLSSLANKVCLDPLTPWIFTVADHIECKWLSLCHAPGIILIDLQFSSVSILETSFLICHTIASTFVWLNHADDSWPYCEWLFPVWAFSFPHTGTVQPPAYSKSFY